jgi:hypothetical protein
MLPRGSVRPIFDGSSIPIKTGELNRNSSVGEISIIGQGRFLEALMRFRFIGRVKRRRQKVIHKSLTEQRLRLTGKGSSTRFTSGSEVLSLCGGEETRESLTFETRTTNTKATI